MLSWVNKLFVLLSISICIALWGSDAEKLLKKDVFNLNETEIKVIFFHEAPNVHNKMIAQTASEGTTVKQLTAVLNDLYLLGNIQLGLRRYVATKDEGMYYYSGPLEKHLLITSVIKEYNTNEFYTVSH